MRQRPPQREEHGIHVHLHGFRHSHGHTSRHHRCARHQQCRRDLHRPNGRQLGPLVQGAGGHCDEPVCCSCPRLRRTQARAEQNKGGGQHVRRGERLRGGRCGGHLRRGPRPLWHGPAHQGGGVPEHAGAVARLLADVRHGGGPAGGHPPHPMGALSQREGGAPLLRQEVRVACLQGRGSDAADRRGSLRGRVGYLRGLPWADPGEPGG
mmetsp:Transcript_14101/g.30155  ORF Transcript_14101/g.30155 Transcript_14101/m.30155 type:complete len:209 (+) Transcript_14101:524-1150(+)